MTEKKPVNADMLAKVRRLVTELEAGNQDVADELLSDLTNIRESSLFQELGKLTREFHDALNGFRYDERLAGIAQADIPDAKERLTYVIKKTDEAAHKTLSALEFVMPICETLGGDVNGFKVEWNKFVNRELGPQQFRELSHKLATFFNDSPARVDDIRKNLNEVMMAQDYQDITGQIIKRVIALVDELEKSLVNLIKIGSQVPGAHQKAAPLVVQPKLEGPQIPGKESENALKGQDDVDDLLSSLGF